MFGKPNKTATTKLPQQQPLPPKKQTKNKDNPPKNKQTNKQNKTKTTEHIMVSLDVVETLVDTFKYDDTIKINRIHTV